MSLNKSKQTGKTQFALQFHALGRFTKASILSPKCGDLIEIDMEIYYHWAVFVGGGKVVYIQPPTNPDTEGLVSVCDLANLAPSCLMRINNKTVPSRRKKLKPFCQEEIVKNALSCVGRLVPYNLLYKNSEHYITEWRFGQSWSDQASTVLQARSIFRQITDSTAAHIAMVTGINRILRSPHRKVGKT